MGNRTNSIAQSKTFQSEVVTLSFISILFASGYRISGWEGEIKVISKGRDRGPPGNRPNMRGGGGGGGRGRGPLTLLAPNTSGGGPPGDGPNTSGGGIPLYSPPPPPHLNPPRKYII